MSEAAVSLPTTIEDPRPAPKRKPAAKKAEPKKAAKKRGKVKTEKRNSGPTGVRYAFPPDAKVVWTTEGNPCRPGTARHERVERVRRHAGKSVGSLLETGTKPRTINVCVKRKWCRVG